MAYKFYRIVTESTASEIVQGMLNGIPEIDINSNFKSVAENIANNTNNVYIAVDNYNPASVLEQISPFFDTNADIVEAFGCAGEDSEMFYSLTFVCDMETERRRYFSTFPDLVLGNVVFQDSKVFQWMYDGFANGKLSSGSLAYYMDKLIHERSLNSFMSVFRNDLSSDQSKIIDSPLVLSKFIYVDSGVSSFNVCHIDISMALAYLNLILERMTPQQFSRIKNCELGQLDFEGSTRDSLKNSVSVIHILLAIVYMDIDKSVGVIRRYVHKFRDLGFVFDDLDILKVVFVASSRLGVSAYFDSSAWLHRDRFSLWGKSDDSDIVWIQENMRSALSTSPDLVSNLSDVVMAYFDDRGKINGDRLKVTKEMITFVERFGNVVFRDVQIAELLNVENEDLIGIVMERFKFDSDQHTRLFEYQFIVDNLSPKLPDGCYKKIMSYVSELLDDEVKNFGCDKFDVKDWIKLSSKSKKPKQKLISQRIKSLFGEIGAADIASTITSKKSLMYVVNDLSVPPYDLLPYLKNDKVIGYCMDLIAK